MEELVNLFHGFAVALQPFNIMVMVVGIVLGVVIGVLPGLGGANGVAILLPLTFSMPPTSPSSCCPVSTGERCSAGRSPRSCSTYRRAMVGRDHVRRLPDGAKGQGRRGIDSGVYLVVRRRAVCGDHDHAGRAAGRKLRAAIWSRGENSRSIFLAFCSFVGLSKEPPFKTIAAMMIGFALAAVGLDSITGQLRLTFGFTELLNGFDFLIAVIGLFGIGEILLTMEEGLAFRAAAPRSICGWCCRPGRKLPA